MHIERCDECGGHVSGRFLGFEAACRCYRGRRPRRAMTDAERGATAGETERLSHRDLPGLQL